MPDFTFCPNCKTKYRTAGTPIGKRLRCKKCQGVFVVQEADHTKMPVAAVKDSPSPSEKDAEHAIPAAMGGSSALDRANFKGSVTLGRSPLASASDSMIAYDTFNDPNVTVSGQFEVPLSSAEADEKYVVEDEIARGGMGVILRAADRDIRRAVAMKVMLEHKSERDKTRFVEEAQITGQLEHPNIVPIHELGLDAEGRLFFTMKLVKGKSLAEVLKALRKNDGRTEHEYSLGRLLSAFVSVCNAMAFAHSKGVVHRDLKPANIMLGDYGEVMVMDWGLAKPGAAAPKTQTRGEEHHRVGSDADEAAEDKGTDSRDRELSEAIRSLRDESGGQLTMEGTIIGTPHYMPPEQADARIDEIDARSDIYSLGAILYEILTLKSPCEGRNIWMLLKNVSEGNITPPDRRTPKRNIPKELSAIAMKALELRKEDRYQRVEELRRDIELFTEGRAVSAKADTFTESIAKLVKRNKAVSLVAASAFLVLMLGGGLSIWVNYEARQRAEAELSQRLLLEREKEEMLAATRRNAEESVQHGEELLHMLESPLATSTSQGSLISDREKALVEAQTAYRKALFLLPGLPQAEQGMRQASLAHFALALEMRNWRQANEKLEQARSVGLPDADYEKHRTTLVKAETARETHIRERIEALMVDAQQTKRQILHEAARSELISLRDPLTVSLLLQYVAHKNANCRQLALDSLAWMEDPIIAAAALPYIQRKGPDGNDNPESVQEAAIRAICNIAPNDNQIFEAVFKRAMEEPTGSPLHSRLFSMRRGSDCYSRYVSLMSRNVGSEQNPKTSISKQEWWFRARKCLAGGLFDQAILCANRAIQQDPKYREAFNLRGLAQHCRYNYVEAVKDFTKYIELAPEGYLGYSNRALAHSASGNWLSAIKDANEALRMKDATNWAKASAYRVRGLSNAFVGNLDDALKDLSHSLTYNSDKIGIYNNIAIARGIEADFDGALEACRRGLELYPSAAFILDTRANVNYLRGDFQSAVADCANAIRADQTYATPYVTRSLVDLSLGQLTNAVVGCNKALDVNKYCVEALATRSYAKQMGGNLLESLVDIEQAVGSILPPPRSWPINDGIAHIRHDGDGVLKEFARIQPIPNVWSAWAARTVICLALGKDDEYRRSMQEAQKVYPNAQELEFAVRQDSQRARRISDALPLEGRDLVSADDRFRRGCARFLQRRFVEAEADLKAAVLSDAKLGPKGAFGLLAEIAATKQDWGGVLGYLRQWVDTTPGSTEAMSAYAWELLESPDQKLRDPQTAFALAQKSATLSKHESPFALQTLAVALINVAQFQRSVEIAEKALSLVPAQATLAERRRYADVLARCKDALAKKTK